MALFKYRVSDSNGKISETVIEAESKTESLSRLKNRSLVPIKYLGETNKAIGNKKSFGRKDFDVYDFTDQLEPLLRAHIPLEKSLKMICDSMEENKGGAVVNSLRRGLHEGRKFSDLIRGHGDRFPKIYGELIESGEKTGQMAQIVAQLRLFLNRSKFIKNFIMNVTMYPIIIIFVIFAVMNIMVFFLIPKISEQTENMGKELPQFTKIVFGIGGFFKDYWYITVALIIGVFIFVRIAKSGGRCKVILDSFLLKIPLIGPLIVDAEINRFTRTLSILIQSHVHVLESVRIATNVLNNTIIANSFGSIQADLRGGDKLSSAMKKSSFVPKIVFQMLQVGEETGSIGQILQEVAEQREELFQNRVKRMLTIMEPALIIGLAVIILIIVIAIFLAIMKTNEI
ncbi:type II secretion system F family protein [Lentisphaerota bacterium WC36G]|nr:type II secretion system F family protein [Lentisphaerae bacterium WC36]